MTLGISESLTKGLALSDYGNEKECGEAIRAWLKETGTPREELFYTTKLMTNVSYEQTLKDIDASIKACGLEYIDLYLLHSAIGGPEKRRECWRAVCDAKKAGKRSERAHV